MLREERDAASIWDMLQAAQGILENMAGLNANEYKVDINRMLANERRFEILGEAARRISVQFKDLHPEIPWREIIAQRNYISHEYDEVDPVRILRVSNQDIPDLIESLVPIVAEMKRNGLIPESDMGD